MPHPLPRTRHLLTLALSAAALLLILLAAAGCSSNPTPFQPLAEDGGYEESRLQERVFRVSFKGNRHTQEADVLDFLFLRCAEVTRGHGYTHFQVMENLGRTQMQLRPKGNQTTWGLGFGQGNQGSFWSMNMAAAQPTEYQEVVSYNLAMFVIRTFTAEEAAVQQGELYEAEFLIRSLTPKKEASLKGDS